MYKNFFLLLLTSFLLVQCSSSDDDSNTMDQTASYDRSKMLIHWVDNIINPAYSAFNTDLSNLDSSTKAFVANPNQSNLDDLRTKWLVSYKSWQHVEMFDIGKAEEIYYRLKMNVYPIDKTWLENNISNGSYDLDKPENYAAQGFSALDYMLYGLGADDTEILNKFKSGVKYSNYLTALVNKMASLTSTVIADWTNNRETFIGSTDNTASSSTNKLINDFIFYYEKGFRANKIGIPAGVFSGGSLPSKVESFYKKDISKDLALEAMEANIKFFNGTSFDGSSSGPSLKSYLIHLNSTKNNTSLSSKIETKLQSAKNSINSLSNNFVTQIQTDNNKMLTTYDQIQTVVVLLKVDMLQAFDISTDYVDADGD